MRAVSGMFHAASLLSRMYLGIVFGFVFWAIIPLAIGWTPTVVISGSMSPNVMVGDILIAQKLNPEQKKEITVGQVLLAEDPSHHDSLVTHRVINVLKDEAYITKGDANSLADKTPIPVENVQGLERLRIPLIGLPIQAFRAGDFTPMVIFILTTATAQLLVLHSRAVEKAKSGKQVPTPNRRTGLSGKTKLLRFSRVLVTSMAVVSLSVVAASSAAIFSGTTASNTTAFTTISDFTAAYKDAVLTDSPSHYYRLNEASGMTATDFSGNGKNNGKDAKYSGSGITYKESQALTRDSTDKAVTLDGKKGTLESNKIFSPSQSATIEIWFKTTTVNGGKLIGFSADVSGVDRVLYMADTGKIMFGIDSTTKATIASTAAYNDGKWHLATATISGLNASLYMDGVLVSSGTTSLTPASANGQWVIGGGSMTGWANQSLNTYFTGSIDEVAVYPHPLPASRILHHFNVA